MQTEIQHKWFYNQSPQEVWDYLTKPELMQQWLMKNDFELIVGHDFQFRTNPIPDLNFDGIFYCKVLEIIPLKKLSYSWKCGPGNHELTLDSIVVWTLNVKYNGTELFLKHAGFKEIENFNMYTALKDGWLKNMQKIAELLKAAKHGAPNI
ncbi:MAG: SRPBCC domain-containing protein [Bacteroidota bacterium]|nr:SRPBCC domain-containing protein [Bacteroidota bacterium]